MDFLRPAVPVALPPPADSFSRPAGCGQAVRTPRACDPGSDSAPDSTADEGGDLGCATPHCLTLTLWIFKTVTEISTKLKAE